MIACQLLRSKTQEAQAWRLGINAHGHRQETGAHGMWFGDEEEHCRLYRPTGTDSDGITKVATHVFSYLGLSNSFMVIDPSCTL